MEHIKKYNQILLAVGGTGLLVFMFFLGLLAISESLRRSNFFGKDDHNSSGIIATEKTDELAQDSIRKQIISFNQLELLDTTNRLFLIPVGQANLVQQESTRESVKNNFSIDNTTYGSTKSYSYGTIFNNLVLFDALAQTSTILFDGRISISEYTFIQVATRSYLMIKATDSDSNQDGYIDGLDHQQLYVYDIGNASLKKVETKQNLDLIYWSEYKGGSEILVQYGLDRNGDGKFWIQGEPRIYYQLDLETAQLKPIIQEAQIDRLQQLLEGQ